MGNQNSPSDTEKRFDYWNEVAHPPAASTFEDAGSPGDSLEGELRGPVRNLQKTGRAKSRPAKVRVEYFADELILTVLDEEKDKTLQVTLASDAAEEIMRTVAKGFRFDLESGEQEVSAREQEGRRELPVAELVRALDALGIQEDALERERWQQEEEMRRGSMSKIQREREETLDRIDAMVAEVREQMDILERQLSERGVLPEDLTLQPELPRCDSCGLVVPKSSRLRRLQQTGIPTPEEVKAAAEVGRVSPLPRGRPQDAWGMACRATPALNFLSYEAREQARCEMWVEANTFDEERSER